MKSAISLREVYGFRMGITLTGGEPMLNKRAVNFVELAKTRYGFDCVSMVTNGSLVTREKLLSLYKAGLDWLAVSIDGAKSATNDAIRGKDTFKQAINTIKLAVENTEMYVSSSFTLTKYNVNEVSEYVELISKLGANQAHVNMFIPQGRGAINRDKLEVSPLEELEIMKLIRRLELKYLKNNFLVSFGEPFYGLTDPIEPFGEIKYLEKKPACGIATKSVTVTPQGYVYPCAYIRDMVIGNLLKQSLSDIWSHELMQKLREEPPLRGLCGECEFKAYCRGCRARAYLMSGDLFEEDPYCPLVLLKKGWKVSLT
jgi:radical SAM protein with 4Fe4S-binding SPASM domain